MAIRTVVFDVGETLVAEGRMWATWAEVCGIPPFTFVAVLGAAIAAGNPREVFARLGVDAAPLRAEFLRRFGGYRPADLYPDAVEAVAALRGAGLRAAVAGNQPAWAMPALRAAGIVADDDANSEDWGVAKPDPDFFRRCCALVGALPQETVYVGDDPVRDVLAARAAGLATAWVHRGPWAAMGDPAAGRQADVVLKGLGELVAAIPHLRPTAWRDAPA